MYRCKREKKLLFRRCGNSRRLTALVLLTALLGLTLAGCASGGSDLTPPQTVPATRPAQTEQTPAPAETPAQQPVETPAEAPETEGPTEAPTEPRAPISAVAIVDYMSAYICYWEELQANLARIEAYTRGDQTALFDVCGSEIPELFYFAQNPDEPYYYDLYILSYEAGKLKPVQSFPKVYGEVQYSDSIAILGSSAEKAMAVYYIDSSESGGSRTLTLYRDGEAPELRAEKLESYDEPDSEDAEYTADGAPTDEAGWEKACREALAGFDQPIVNSTYGYGDPAALTELLEGEAPLSCGLDDMIAYLQNKMSGN